MKRLARSLSLYALALLMGLGAMAWMTVRTLRTERAEMDARARADRSERERLAQWRMDSTLSLFLAPESARPWSDYQAFRPADGGTGWSEGRGGGRAMAPSPLLLTEDVLVLLRFQIDESSRVTSPLVQDRGRGSQVAAAGVSRTRMETAQQRLKQVESRLSLQKIREAMSKQGAFLMSRREKMDLQGRTEGRMARRGRWGSPFTVYQGAWTPFWLDGELYMTRQVWVGDRELVQGCWLDWAMLKEVLLSTIRDALPGADLAPVGPEDQALKGRLSGLPVRLMPGATPIGDDARAASSRAVLAAGWGLALLGAMLGGIVLVRSTLQSERRGAFASAVAHELRTPLTTFRLYTEMLAKGMVEDEAERSELHETLAREADRLDHLVKNVLAYARLEAGRGLGSEEVQAGDLLDRLCPRLAERARQGGMGFDPCEDGEIRGLFLRTDPLAVEQILFNLVDNACKYASGCEGSVRLILATEHGDLVIRVEDRGPGISDEDRRRLFRPFEKIGPKASRQAPGVGLGLALSRRLARILGGDLLYVPSEKGAAFSLRLPLKK